MVHKLLERRPVSEMVVGKVAAALSKGGARNNLLIQLGKVDSKKQEKKRRFPVSSTEMTRRLKGEDA